MKSTGARYDYGCQISGERTYPYDTWTYEDPTTLQALISSQLPVPVTINVKNSVSLSLYLTP